MQARTRREFLKAIGLAAASAAASSVLPGCASLGSITKQAKDRPNIIFIMSDDHASNAISCYGGILSKVIKTPNIDRLAKEGMRFDNCFVTNSLCEPSRAVILTGKYGHITGVVNNASLFDSKQQTFTKLLQKAGYQTALVGKWHLIGSVVGFDYWNILPGQGVYYNPYMLNMGKPKKYQGYVTDVVTDVALDFLKNKRDTKKPFCLLYQHKAPHENWKPNTQHLTMYDDVEMPVPDTFDDDFETRTMASRTQWLTISKHLRAKDFKLTQPQGLTEEQLKAWNAAYGPKNEAMRKANLTEEQMALWKYQRYIKDFMRTVASVDDNLGRVLDYLDESGLAENTIVIYTADNGFFLGEHGWYDKRFMYEESIRIPLIVRYPKEIKPGSVNDDIVMNLDFAETFLDFAEAPIPRDMQGKSIRPLLNGNTPGDWRKSMYYHFYEYPGFNSVKRHYGVRTERYKLIHFYYDDDAWELYDLKTDPKELNNVYNSPAYADVVKETEAELRRLQKQYGDSDDLAADYIRTHPRGDLRGIAGNVLPPEKLPKMDAPH